MIDKTAVTEYEALARLSTANRRANGILFALIAIILLAALVGGWSIYKAQQAAFDKQTVQRTKNTNNALKEYRTIAIESIRYHTCLDVLPVAERTPAAQRDCFKKADLPGGLTEDDFVTVPPDRVVSALDNEGPNQGFSGSSSQSAPSSTSSPTNNSQTSQKSNDQNQPIPPSAPKNQGIIPDSVPILGPLL